MICENSIGTYIFPYVKQMIGANLMHESGHPKLELWDNSEGWGGRGLGGGLRMVGHMYTHG